VEPFGQVFLIGAGPGDPGLLTLRGAELLSRADVVLYDYLTPAVLLKHCRVDCETVCLGRHGAGKLWTQTQINERMIAAALAGKTVVRLKGGDPGIFGRLAEELAALRAANLPYEIVPGVTTAVAAGAYAEVTLTDRDAASCVAFVTGHENPQKDDTLSLDFAALAKFPGTLVIYMGFTTAPLWSAELIRHGMSVTTPVLIVRKCSLPTQESFAMTLGDVATELAPGKMRPPLVAIVGAVSASGVESWFTRRPLFGKTVLVTRPEHQADELADRLTELGARVLRQPVITISPPEDRAAFSAAVTRATGYDWIVFSSANGVEAFFTELAAQGLDARSLYRKQIAVIGPATSDALLAHGLFCDLQPEEYRAEALADALAPLAGGMNVMLIRASRGRDVLYQELLSAGSLVEQTIAYRSEDVAELRPEIAAALEAGEIDWVTVTSSAIARSLVKLAGDSLKRTKLVAISPLTAGVLAELGYPATAVAEEFTSAGVVAAVLCNKANDT
jgi:uroporphyrinogen III methyltransferase / synthase